jgi:transcriptional regulator with XRE-family HTH domain
MSTTRIEYVCNRLREERSRLGIAQQAVADLCEVHLKTAQRWELGVAMPADMLGVLGENGFDVQYICTGVRSKAQVVDDADAAFVSGRFRKERLRLGLVHSEVVKQTGFSKSEVLDWERGSLVPVSVLKTLRSMGFDIEYISTGQITSDESDPVLTPFEWKLLKKVRAMNNAQQKQALVMVEVLGAGAALGGNTTVITGDNKRVAGRDYVENRGPTKPKKGK